MTTTLENIHRAKSAIEANVPRQPTEEAIPRVRYANPAPRTTAMLAIVVAGLLSVVQGRIGWAQVVDATKTPRWIHGTLTINDKPVSGDLWLSRPAGVWAIRNVGGRVVFADAKQKVKFIYDRGPNSIQKLPLGSDSMDNVLPLTALARGEGSVGSSLLETEKVVFQTRREVSDDDGRWIEFDLRLHRGDAATLRVDPQTRLPVHLTYKAPNRELRWSFAYRAKGPADIFALGVDRATPVQDRTWKEPVAKMMAEVDRNRELIADFKAVAVGESQSQFQVVQRKGRRWRVDLYFAKKRVDELPEGVSWSRWFAQNIDEMRHRPKYICDGNSVMENTARVNQPPRWQHSARVTADDLMQCGTSSYLQYANHARLWARLYPQLSPQVGWGFDVVFEPPERPDCVLVKQSAELASVKPTIGASWRYLDPSRGYSVVSIVSFSVPKGKKLKPENSETVQMVSMDDFVRSPGGWWYCQRVTFSEGQGPDFRRSATADTSGPKLFHFDFAAEMPDELFQLPKAAAVPGER